VKIYLDCLPRSGFVQQIAALEQIAALGKFTHFALKFPVSKALSAALHTPAVDAQILNVSFLGVLVRAHGFIRKRPPNDQ